MLSVIIDASRDEDRLAGLLAALTPAAVEGLVREVLVSGAAWSELVADQVDAMCEDTGAELVGELGAAIARSRSELVLVLPARIRFTEGWVERLGDFLAAGGRAAILEGRKAGGPFAGRPYGLLIGKAAASGLVEPDLQGLRRQLGPAGGRRLR
ncbi:cell wall biosynthesis glycosyltransferase [Phenylobacterium sp.]|uniref:cell wall biosynthesis glycosyltransferase n=1 Tax=Phenylobacterium sp. TaxID=1871053 RepID=UPI0035B3D830